MKKTIDSNKPVGKMIRISDFLPSPEKLAMPKETVKITISLDKGSVEFFKHQAKQHHTKYQKMIRNLLNSYAGHHMSR